MAYAKRYITRQIQLAGQDLPISYDLNLDLMVLITPASTWKVLGNTSFGKEIYGNDHSTRQVAVESRESKCLSFSNVKLKVHKSPRDDKHLPSSQDFGVTHIVTCQRTYEELPFNDHNDLACKRVQMRRVESTRFIAISRVFNPGNVRTFPGVREDAKIFVVLPTLVKPSKKKSSEVASDAGLQGKPFTSSYKEEMVTRLNVGMINERVADLIIDRQVFYM